MTNTTISPGLAIHSHSMERLRVMILKLCNSNKFGARAVVTDDSSVTLYDCMEWTEEYTETLRLHYPEIEIVVKACKHSLSGFNMIFHLRKRGREWIWILIIGALVAACLFCIWRWT